MKFTCQRDTILKEVDYANNFTSQRNSLTISSNILLENFNNTLTIKSTDNKLGFTTSFPVATEIPGSTTVTCDKFLAILKNLPATDIEFEDDNDKMAISPVGEGKKIKFNLKTLPADRFPELLTVEDSEYFSLSQRDFFDMISKTSFAVGTDESKYFLTGIYLEKKNDQLVMVATDGKRLSCIRKSFEQQIPDIQSCIIPVKFLNILSIIGAGEGLLSLAITPSSIFASVNGHFIYSSLIIGQYPAYERVIPQSFTYSCNAKVEEMLAAINRVSLFVDASSKKIFLDLNQDGIMVSGENAELGDAKEIVQCEYSGPEAKISFNINFFKTPLTKIDSDNFKLCYNTVTSAMAIFPDPEKDYIFIIMPMHG